MRYFCDFKKKQKQTQAQKLNNETSGLREWSLTVDIPPKAGTLGIPYQSLRPNLDGRNRRGFKRVIFDAYAPIIKFD